MAPNLLSEASGRPTFSNERIVLAVGVPFLTLVLVFFYYIFPIGFLFVLIAGALLILLSLFGRKQAEQSPNEETPLLQSYDAQEKSNNEIGTVHSSFGNGDIYLPVSESLSSPAPMISISTSLAEQPAAGSIGKTGVEVAEIEPFVTDTSTNKTKDTSAEQLVSIQVVSREVNGAEEAETEAKAVHNSKEVVFLYGSQLGNSMDIAKSISSETLTHGVPSKAYAMDDFSFERLPSVSIAIFVVSSTGEGDPPDNCKEFYDTIRQNTHSSTLLSGIQYTVLGLGDSKYESFMTVPRVFSSRLPELGGACFYSCCEADEAHGMDDTVDDWEDGLWEPLKEVYAKETAKYGATNDSSGEVSLNEVVEEEKEEEIELVGVPALQPRRVRVEWLENEMVITHDDAHTLERTGGGESKVVSDVARYDIETSPSVSSPFMAKVSHAKYLTASWSDRVVIHMEVDVTDSGINFKAGDSMGVVPQNRVETVDQLVERLGVDAHKKFRIVSLDSDGKQEALSHIKQPCDLREVFLKYVDITSVAKKGLLRVLAEYCAKPKEKNRLLYLSSKGGKDAYKTEVHDGRPGLLDLLLLFPSCKPDIAHLLDTLPPLVSRFYSLTNSSKADPNHMQVAFSVVKMETLNGRLFLGVATNYMERMLAMESSRERSSIENPPVYLPVFVKEGGSFQHPESLECPIIMIGPGTGVGPFRGFLQERSVKVKEGGERESGSIGEAWLFYGCRRDDEDYLYREDLEDFEQGGVLTKLVVAFSRAQEEKVYVQHKLMEHGGSVYSLLQHPKAHILVCGDGARMAKDVHAALVSLVAEYGHMDEPLASAYLAGIMADKRYLRDIWS